MKLLSLNEIFDTAQPPELKTEARAFWRLNLPHFQVERKRGVLDLILGLRVFLLNRSTISRFCPFVVPPEDGSTLR
jgi:hypothetical protein